MTRVHSDDKYDYYLRVAVGDQCALYNIVPKTAGVPSYGYFRMADIERKRGVKFPDRYQRRWLEGSDGV